jgi:hypothetical protein
MAPLIFLWLALLEFRLLEFRDRCTTRTVLDFPENPQARRFANPFRRTTALSLVKSNMRSRNPQEAFVNCWTVKKC